MSKTRETDERARGLMLIGRELSREPRLGVEKFHRKNAAFPVERVTFDNIFGAHDSPAKG